jgi:hypothetical protein
MQYQRAAGGWTGAPPSLIAYLESRRRKPFAARHTVSHGRLRLVRIYHKYHEYHDTRTLGTATTDTYAAFFHRRVRWRSIFPKHRPNDGGLVAVKWNVPGERASHPPPPNTNNTTLNPRYYTGPSHPLVLSAALLLPSSTSSAAVSRSLEESKKYPFCYSPPSLDESTLLNSPPPTRLSIDPPPNVLPPRRHSGGTDYSSFGPEQQRATRLRWSGHRRRNDD